MRSKILIPAFSIVAFCMCQLVGAQPGAVLMPAESVLPTAAAGEKDKPKLPDIDKKLPEKKSADVDPFTQSPTMGNQFPTGFNPHMIGDFGTFFVQQTFTVTGTRTTTSKIVTVRADPMEPLSKNVQTKVVKTTVPVSETRTILVPFASSAAAFKVADNESPRPVDRVFGIYNHFSGIRSPYDGPPTNSVTSSQTVAQLSRFTTRTNTIDVVDNFTATPQPIAQLNREIFGFEKTFLDGFASIEFRVPFLQQTANIAGFGAQNAGDLTIVTKYAFLLDNQTGDVVSAGLALTLPTGPGYSTVDGQVHAALIQPWFGYIWNSGDIFVQGFHSIVVPTDSRDVTLLFNDVGLSYWLYRGDANQFVNSLVPTLELHLTTPLNHRSADAPIFVPDLLVLTGGLHIGIMGNTSLTLGVATPITGPRVFNVEAFVQLNWRY